MSHSEGSLSHLTDAVSNSPGEEDSGQDLKAGQNQRRRYDPWNEGDKQTFKQQDFIRGKNPCIEYEYRK